MKRIKFLTLAAAAALLCCVSMVAGNDPVLMTIAGKDIRLSEFANLYQKNNATQKEDLPTYLKRFVLYKQKVADAEALGYDTTRLFRKEFEGYRKDIETPYLQDTTMRWQYLQEAYGFTEKNVNIDHMMLPLGRTDAETQANIARMDSIRGCVLAGQQWEELAAKYSTDPSLPRNQGHYGWITANTFPYTFEKVAFTTPVGTIANAFTTAYGVHLVRVNDVRPDAGTVHAQHILVLYGARQPSDAQKAAARAKIDSIYRVLQGGADFSKVATECSQDPGSAKKGGDLGFFGKGKMVPQFEQMAFSLKDGEMSAPFETPYGYHVVKVLEHKGVPSFAEARKGLEARINHDERAEYIRDAKIAQIKQIYGYKDNAKVAGYLDKQLKKNGGYDSTFVANVVAKSDMPLYTFDKNQQALLRDVTPNLNPKAKFVNNEAARDYILSKAAPVAEKQLTEYYAQHLMDVNPDYRNIMTEYRDGILLYNISNDKVWKAAERDTAGLRDHFLANRDKYAWTSPHFKGIILYTKNDSVEALVNKELKELRAAGEPLDTITHFLHNTHGTQVRMERMVVAQGEKKVVDYLFFHTLKDKPENKGYANFQVLDGKLINAPEDYKDVRGQVTSDYQDVLEQRWEAELAKKYPAKINQSALKSLPQ